jgi:hypothetical protein
MNIEAIELTTASWYTCEGLEGGFLSFDQHALSLSTFERLGRIVHYSPFFRTASCEHAVDYFALYAVPLAHTTTSATRLAS